MRGFRTRKSAEKMRKNGGFLVVGGGREREVLSQMCLIWRKRVLAIGGASSSVSSLRLLIHPSRATAPKPL